MAFHAVEVGLDFFLSYCSVKQYLMSRNQAQNCMMKNSHVTHTLTMLHFRDSRIKFLNGNSFFREADTCYSFLSSTLNYNFKTSVFLGVIVLFKIDQSHRVNFNTSQICEVEKHITIIWNIFAWNFLIICHLIIFFKLSLNK